MRRRTTARTSLQRGGAPERSEQEEDMKLNAAGYKVIVTVGQESDFVLVTTYDLDTGKHYVGFDFSRCVLSIPDTGISIPEGRQATFREELRCFDRASAATAISRQKEDDFIRQKLQEAYGSSVKIDITRLTT
jgi:hypothetical protein